MSSSCNVNHFVVKFSGDTALLSFSYENSDPSVYFSEVSRFVEWCDLNNLIFNLNKKDRRGDFRPQ